MNPARTVQFLVLDFDGVICNADDECKLVTWLGVHPPTGSAPVSSYLTAIDDDFTARFRYIRGYARLLEHLLVAHHPEAERIRTRAQFADLFNSFPASQVTLFTQAATAARHRFRTEEPGSWMALHPLHRGVPRALRAGGGAIAIATARDVPSVSAALEHHGLRGTVAHIAGGCQDKAAFVLELCEQLGLEPGDMGFADDNIENVLAVAATGARAYWAMWGHRQPEDLATARRAGTARLELEELAWLASA